MRTSLFILITVICSCSQHESPTQENNTTNGELHGHESYNSEFTVNDSIKVEDLFRKCDSLNNNDELDSALKMAQEALSISEKKTYKRGIAGAKYRLGEVYSTLENYTDAMTAIDEAMPFYVDIDAKERLANLYNMKGNVYTDLGYKPKALNEYLTAMKFYEAIGDKEGIAICHGNIGNINADMGRNEEALTEYETVLKICLEMDNKRMASMTYNNLGTIYVAQNKLPEALKNHQLSLEIKQETGDKRGESIAYNNIGAIYIMQGKYDEALQLFIKALQLSEETGDKDNVALSSINIGWAKIKRGRAADAKEWINKGLLLAKELDIKERIVDSYIRLYEADSALGNFKGAFQYNKLYNAYKNSLINEENIQKTVESQIQYDFDKKEAISKAEQDKREAIAKEALEKQKLVRNIFIGGFAVVFIFALIFFRQRNKISKARKQSDELLLNILPAEIAEELKANGSSDAKQFDEVTVLFTDFKDFTQITEKMTPKEMVAEIDTCFKAFDQIIDKYGIEKIKTIGDSYMCAGGLPVANTSHAEDVLAAALEIQAFISTRAAEKKASGQEAFQIRIGIHTGPVVAGIVGIKKFAYDIWGDTVNTASRMESSGEAGKVNISEATYALVKSKFKCSPRGKIMAKNKGEMDMYFVEGSF